MLIPTLVLRKFDFNDFLLFHDITCNESSNLERYPNLNFQNFTQMIFIWFISHFTSS